MAHEILKLHLPVIAKVRLCFCLLLFLMNILKKIKPYTWKLNIGHWGMKFNSSSSINWDKMWKNIFLEVTKNLFVLQSEAHMLNFLHPTTVEQHWPHCGLAADCEPTICGLFLCETLQHQVIIGYTRDLDWFLFLLILYKDFVAWRNSCTKIGKYSTQLELYYCPLP